MKILYVTTVSNTVNAFLVPHINFLFDIGHQVDVAFRIDRPVQLELSSTLPMGSTSTKALL